MPFLVALVADSALAYSQRVEVGKVSTAVPLGYKRRITGGK